MVRTKGGMGRRLRLGTLLLAGHSALAWAPALAQQPIDPPIGPQPTGVNADAAPDGADATSPTEIVVTAQQRSESIQKVPLSITAVTGAFLDTRKITSFQDYATLVPNISFGYATSSVGESQSIALRGVFGRGTTGLYLDESPLPGSIDTRIVDLERIEVLRGPQGSLYGARSMGGTVRLLTTQPDGDRISARVHAGGSFTRHGGFNNTTDGTLNVPIAGEALALRVNGFYDRDLGIYTRIPRADAPAPFAANEHIDTAQKWGGSIALRSELADGKLVITPRVLIQRSDYDGRPYADISPDNFVQRRLFDNDEPGRDHYELYTLTAAYDVGAGTITSATSQLNRRTRDSEDISDSGPDFGFPEVAPSVIRLNTRTRAFSQELRFNSAFNGPFQLTAGGFYQRTKRTGTFPPTVYPPFTDIYSIVQDTDVEEKAIFAEANLEVFRHVTATVGGRMFWNDFTIATVQGGLFNDPGSFGGAQREKGFNPKFNLRYEPTRDLTFYVNAAKGFRIGGANLYQDVFCGPGLAQIGLTGTGARTFKSDSVWSYEIGGKAALLERRLRLTGAVFQIDWDDIQQTLVIPVCGQAVNVNAGRARNRGFELEGTLTALRGLTLGFGVGYTDAKIIEAGSTVSTIKVGSQVQQVPHWTANGNAQWDFELGSLRSFLTADVSHVGSSVSAFNDAFNPRDRPAYQLVNLRLGVRPGDLEVSVFARNVFDVHANFADVPPLGVELPGRPRLATNRPRTIGIDVTSRF